MNGMRFPSLSFRQLLRQRLWVVITQQTQKTQITSSLSAAEI